MTPEIKKAQEGDNDLVTSSRAFIPPWSLVRDKTENSWTRHRVELDAVGTLVLIQVFIYSINTLSFLKALSMPD